MQENIYGVIYIIRNKINNKLYIGQTSSKRGFDGRYDRGGIPIEKVYKFYLSHKRNGTHYNKHLLGAIKTYGFEAFEVDKKFDVAYSQEELNKLEDMYIEIYNCRNPKYGYNDRAGGNNGKASKQTIERMSKAFSGNKNPFYGKHHTEETKKILSSQHKGKKLPKEVILKLGLPRGKHPQAIKVICTTTNKIFDCINDGADYYHCDNSSILKCCKGTRITCGKLNDGTRLKWMFYNEYIKTV